MRIAVGVLLAVLVNFGLFLLMQHMTTSDGLDRRVSEDIRLLDFVRIKREETPPEIRKREPPPPPPPPEQAPPPPPEAPVPQPDVPQTPTPRMDIPRVDVPMNITGGPYLGDFAAAPAPAPAAAPAQVQAPAMDDEVVPLVRIPPTYPRMAARRGIEGVVTVQFTIMPDGSVRDPKVIKATPENVFNDEALKAILRWKFKPKLVDGRPVERQAVQEIEFKLAR